MSVVNLKCPYCGGWLTFDPTSQSHKCEYCGSNLTQAEVDELQASQVKETEEIEKKSEGLEANVYNCSSCGAEIVAEETTASTFCYYCHSPIVLSGRVEGEFLPNKIIPFKIEKKEAEKKFLEYVGSKKFIPKYFFNKKQIELLSGVYFPYWVCDADLKGNMDAEARKVRVWRTGDTEHTETKVYRIEREGNIHLKDLSKNALQKANHKLIDGVMPYNMGEAKDFQMGYLSGFMSEKRDIEKEAYEAEVEAEFKRYGESMLSDTVTGYTSVTSERYNMLTENTEWSYVLLPVWTVTYKGKDGKMYYYSLNGQTGKVFGELPVNYKKVWSVAGIISVSVFVLGLIGGYIL